MSSEAETRRCNICKLDFPLTSEFFYKNKNFKGGLAYACKSCDSARKHKHYEENKETYKERRKHTKSYKYSDESTELFRKFNPLKKCPRCKIEKPRDFEHFYKNIRRRDGLGSYCKDCGKSLKIKSEYGITDKQLSELYKNHNNLCAICKTHVDNLKEGLCVDHDHTTEEVRGLLCKRCNYAIGLFDDNVHNLENATKYLKDYYESFNMREQENAD